jgi:hypothetical protein
MAAQARFEPVALRRAHPFAPHSAVLRRKQKAQRRRAATFDGGAFLILGLLIAIAVGLLALRAALWLPPLEI